MKLDLTQRELPPKGVQHGIFVDVVEGEMADKRGKKYKTLRLTAQIAAVKSNGQRFMAGTTYNLDDNRGVKRLIDDLKIWRGTSAIPNLDQFDPEAEFLGKHFVCEPKIVNEDGQKSIQLNGFRPDPEKRVNVTAEFVRAKDHQNVMPSAA
jgi:hypothetical protein